MKKKFTESLWFPMISVDIMMITAIVAFAMLSPTGADISNTRTVEIFSLAGWFVGPVMAVLSFILIAILNGLRRLFKLRNVAALHAPVVLLAILPWLVMSWQITAEPRYTNIAKAIIDFAGRPMLWGSLAASIFVIAVGLLGLLSSKK